MKTQKHYPILHNHKCCLIGWPGNLRSFPSGRGIRGRSSLTPAGEASAAPPRRGLYPGPCAENTQNTHGYYGYRLV